MEVEGIDAVAEMVENVATATEDMAEEMEKILPEQSKLKQVAVVLEHISEVAAHEAHLTHDFLQKVHIVSMKSIYEMFYIIYQFNTKKGKLSKDNIFSIR